MCVHLFKKNQYSLHTHLGSCWDSWRHKRLLIFFKGFHIYSLILFQNTTEVGRAGIVLFSPAWWTARSPVRTPWFSSRLCGCPLQSSFLVPLHLPTLKCWHEPGGLRLWASSFLHTHLHGGLIHSIDFKHHVYANDTQMYIFSSVLSL